MYSPGEELRYNNKTATKTAIYSFQKGKYTKYFEKFYSYPKQKTMCLVQLQFNLNAT